MLTKQRQDGETGLEPDRAPAVLELVQRWVQDTGQDAAPGLELLLGELAEALEADGAGLAEGEGGQPVVRWATTPSAMPRCPWEITPDALSRLRQSARALTLPTETGSWLAATVGLSWIIWVEGSASRSWTPGESAALVLAGEALVRLVRSGPSVPAWALQQAHAQRLQRLPIVAQVTRVLAHEFGNVFTSLLGFSELCLARAAPNLGVRPLLEEVLRGAQRGSAFVTRLQQFSRLGSGFPAGESSVLHLVAAEASRLQGACGPGVRVEIDLPHQLPPVALGMEPFSLVLQPLLDNARDAINGEGVIHIGARITELSAADCVVLAGNARPGRHVEIAVRDTGNGLTPEARERLFVQTFYSSKHKRRGLGLAVVQGILLTFHGGLAVEQAPERGTVARLLLPIKATAPTAAIDRSTGQPIRGGT